MSPSARPRLFTSAFFLTLSLTLAQGQEGGAFGMSAANLSKLLAAKDPAPVLAFEDAAIGNTGPYGPAAYYYLARWLDSLDARPLPQPEIDARVELLYRMAFDKTSGVVRRTAGLALVAKLSSAGVWKDLLAFCDEYGKSIGAEWKSERPRLEAYEALGGYAELKALATRLSTAYPTEAAKDADALAYFRAVADKGIRGKTWIKSFRRLLLERPASDWTSRAYSLTTTDSLLRSIFPP